MTQNLKMWAAIQFYGGLTSLFVLSGIHYLISSTIEKVKSDLDKFDVEAQCNSIKRST